MIPPNNKQKILFVNLTKLCNVNCPRCLLKDINRKNKAILPLDVYIKTINTSFFKNNVIPPVIIWEGGEVSILKKDLFESYILKTKEILPNARQRVVTNLFNTPNWLIDFSHQYFDSELETTFALGKKMDLSGSESNFIKKFKENAKKVVDNNILLTVNIELNKETVEEGPEAIIKIAEETGVKNWDFDVSFSYDEYFENPVVTELGYPIIPTNVPYKIMSDYLMSFYELIKDTDIKSSFFDPMLGVNETMMFNVFCEDKFLTLNPDGYITTNALFSDIESSYLGNIKLESLEQILQSPKRLNRIKQEKKRVSQCVSCEFFNSCKGGPSHAPLYDRYNNECAGFKSLFKKIKL